MDGFLGVADFDRMAVEPIRRNSMAARPITNNQKHNTSSDRREDIAGEVNQAMIDSHIQAAFCSKSSNISG